MAGPPSSGMFRCLICILIGFCVAFVLLLTAIIIHRLNINNFTSSSSKTNIDQRISPIAKKRQLPDFVNTNIDPCENFYDFVCDKWSERTKVEEYEQKWTRIRHRMHDKLMINMNNTQSKSSEGITNLFQDIDGLIDYLPLFRHMLEIDTDE